MTNHPTEIACEREEKPCRPELLLGDPVLIRDGPQHDRERPALSFGSHNSACPKKPRHLRMAQLCQVLLVLLFMAGVAQAAGPQPDLMVKLASEGDASYIGRGILESVAQAQTRTDGTFVGTASVYRVLVRNLGDAADSFVLKGTGSATGFKVAYLDLQGTEHTAELSGAGLATGVLAPGDSFSVLVRVTPNLETLGAYYVATVTASSASDAGKVDQVKTETVICGTSAAVMVSVPADDKGLPGNVVSYPYTITNIGNAVNTFALSVTNGAGWPAAISAGDHPVSSTGPLSPGQSYRCTVAVTVPPQSGDLAHATTRLNVSGEGTFAYDEVKTTATAAAVSVSETVRNLTLGGPFAPSVDAFPGDTVEYRMSVTNSGSLPATAVAIDAPMPASMRFLPGTLWIGTSSEGGGAPCPQAQCGGVKEASGTILARLGEGATDAAGGALAPGKTVYVFYRMQVE